jgi:putative chitinase
MKLTSAHLNTIAGGTKTAARQANIDAILLGLDAYGEQVGLNTAPRLAQYIAQLAHESGRFRYDREVWGPTAAQKRYEGRADLGNTQPGDGSKFRGYTPIQITGRANATAFRDWCRAKGLNPPDFAQFPELMNTDPWEGLGPIWFWTTRDLNRYADEGNTEMISRRINGGTNGLSDRLELFVRAGLVLLDYKLEASVVKRFQSEHGLTPDDVAGPATRLAIHKALQKLDTEPSAPAAEAPTDTPVAEAPLTLADYLRIIEAATAAIRQL